MRKTLYSFSLSLPDFLRLFCFILGSILGFRFAFHGTPPWRRVVLKKCIYGERNRVSQCPLKVSQQSDFGFHLETCPVFPWRTLIN